VFNYISPTSVANKRWRTSKFNYWTD